MFVQCFSSIPADDLFMIQKPLDLIFSSFSFDTDPSMLDDSNLLRLCEVLHDFSLIFQIKAVGSAYYRFCERELYHRFQRAGEKHNADYSEWNKCDLHNQWDAFTDMREKQLDIFYEQDTRTARDNFRGQIVLFYAEMQKKGKVAF